LCYSNQQRKVAVTGENYSVVKRLLSVVNVCKHLQTKNILLYLDEKRLTNTKGLAQVKQLTK
jgi:hypothetical protein